MEWIKRLSEFPDTWEVCKEPKIGYRGCWEYCCYLSCYHRYEEFDYISKGEGATIEEAVTAAFADWDKKHGSDNH